MTSISPGAHSGIFQRSDSKLFSGSQLPETTKEDLQQKVNELYEENRQLMKENKS